MDAETGLTYMQQRYYDPRIGMFLSVDPVTAYSDPIGQFHRYRYANNNPYRFTDPDGRWAEDLVIGVPSIIMGAKSFANNVQEGNAGAAVAEAVGVVVDAAAILTPGVPGGAGAAIGVVRGIDNAVDASTTVRKVADAAHGNSKLSQRAQHRYEIVDNRTGEVAKTGISGRPLNANGTSGRANSQINALNRVGGEGAYSARIVETNIPGRQAALNAEAAATARLREAGNELPLQRRP